MRDILFRCAIRGGRSSGESIRRTKNAVQRRRRYFVVAGLPTSRRLARTARKSAFPVARKRCTACTGEPYRHVGTARPARAPRPRSSSSIIITDAERGRARIDRGRFIRRSASRQQRARKPSAAAAAAAADDDDSSCLLTSFFPGPFPADTHTRMAHGGPAWPDPFQRQYYNTSRLVCRCTGLISALHKTARPLKALFRSQ